MTEVHLSQVSNTTISTMLSSMLPEEPLLAREKSWLKSSVESSLHPCFSSFLTCSLCLVPYVLFLMQLVSWLVPYVWGILLGPQHYFCILALSSFTSAIKLQITYFFSHVFQRPITYISWKDIMGQPYMIGSTLFTNHDSEALCPCPSFAEDDENMGDITVLTASWRQCLCQQFYVAQWWYGIFGTI